MSGLPCIELSDPICDMVAVCETTTTLASNVYTNEDGITSDVVTSNTLSLTAGNLTSSVNGVVSNIIASELHGSNSYSHFWRVDEQIDYQVLSADLTLTNDSPGVLHVNGGLGTRVVVLPTPTLVAPNLHGMTFSIKNIGTTNNIEVREGTPTGTLRGTLLPGEWATYRWDTNFPRYFEWK
jgi:hypothetical protein